MSDNQSTVNFVIWFLVLIFLSYWVSCICFVPYIITSIIQVCVPALDPLVDLLLKGLQFPHYCAESMMNRSGLH
ncbi:UNVERIFIED_CONTAM: hypothetical protein PYX00_010145 [Menopon gallinae]|uniref:ATP synthase F0 subunit 8 n=1 Tax=Menopon gallinae TaxID=328185 RepID=A0AAW2HE87_9NEOP